MTAGPYLLMPTYKVPDLTFVAGRGSSLFTADGTEYLDLVAGIAVATVGHAHPAVVDAITAQAGELIHASNLYGTEPQRALALRLAEISGGKQSFFANSGAETIECALKLARRWAGKEHGDRRTKIVAAVGGFHGRTFGALAATGQPAKQLAFEPMLPGFTHVPYGDVAALAEAIGDDVAAVLLEPIQGEAGVVVPPDGYLRSARELCDGVGALLILDEVQTGLGRTGYWLAAEHDEVDADIVCLAKALGGGLPIGACLATPEIAAAFEPGDHATTFGGGPVQCAAALATLHVIESDGLLTRSIHAGARLTAELGARAKVRGRGLMLGVDLGAPLAAEVVKRAADRKVLVNEVTSSVVRLTPPLVITDDEIDRAIAVLSEVLDEI
jgi:predicted acetylornithine/succinylornithine family transaminase